MAERILVLVVDRDDDVGVKAGAEGPIIGEEANIDVAKRLALADPEDTDANTIFYAVKIAKELREKGNIVNIATITGHHNLGFLADMRIRDQLKEVLNRIPADGVVFVTDGAEDDQVIPIITSYVPIIAKRTLIMKQSPEMEKTFYVIKNAMRDKDLAPIVLGVPGIILLLWAILGNLGIKLIIGVVGAYLFMKGFGVWDALENGVKTILKGISLRGAGAPFYVLSLAFLVVAAYTTYQNYIAATGPTAFYSAARAAVGFTSISALLYLTGRILDAHFSRKAFKIGKYLVYAALVVVVWILSDVTIMTLQHNADVETLYSAAAGSIIFYIAIAQIGREFEDAIKHSEKLVGAVAMDRKGNRIGNVVSINREKGIIEIQAGRRKITAPIDKVKVDVNGVYVSV
ncbi:MAG: DUF373 family protein [Candidatus Diapherotrites archaeon]|nr:DUF373 family protein [Candidatus Diapherotrites archaeon]